MNPAIVGSFLWPRPCNPLSWIKATTRMLKIERITESGGSRFRLSGALRVAELDEVRREIQKSTPEIVLDLAEVSVVDRDGVRWLNACKAMGVKVENCAPYILEWMAQENL
jgi:hypothetical protein